ncbi:MAG TPA: TIM-barrel domain-containing protein [Fimbriimonadaceae bacterium]|nr:TIM-barrel domain-containing protein [Fimbriimonadaceae bacterium]
MYFTKYSHPANFTFAPSLEAVAELTSYKGEIHHLRVRGKGKENPLLAPLQPPAKAASKRLSIGEGLSLLGPKGKAIVAGRPGACFAVSGEASLFKFDLLEGSRFYGMGEKTFGRVELSDTQTKFWNTDVWADFHYRQWLDQPTDPPYFSTPYVVCRIGGEYVGFLLDNPYPTWIATPHPTETRLILGAEGGMPSLWIICGPTLPEVTRKLQKMIGVTPTPPLWALGYHQSRWGYAGEADLLDLDAKFEEHRIPCDGLWLDIDYMRGYRVFETDPAQFPKGAKATAGKLHGRRIVPILDPGVKKDPGYPVYDDGLEAKAFCLNAEGKPYVGLVWPGETHFPDFPSKAARDWWAGYAKAFLEEGFGGAWLDMNDPATGSVDPTGMRFNGGAEPHEAYHNQYALGMQVATRQGFLQARPDERPFLLSRSGFTGTSRYAAIWTGDNVSNRFYLRAAIPTTLGLSLSGMPFNGPDMGGFGGDAEDALFADWVKAGFLFPFCRNHSVKDSRRQEPWAFKPGTLRVARHYIRLRYKFLPYLYNLFIDQEEYGDPILRPLFYHFDDKELDALNDQFLVGPFVLQAPHVGEETMRDVVLPGKEPWFDAVSGHWVEPGVLHRSRTPMSTPLFFRNGAIVPMRPGVPADIQTDLGRVEVHLFACPSKPGKSEYLYRADDGLSYGYRRGERSALKIEMEWTEKALRVEWSQIEAGYGKVEPRFVVHGDFHHVVVNGRTAPLRPIRMPLAGTPIRAHRISRSADRR